MKAVILAGGMGTRLAEETDIKPKPLVEIGGRPILWHIMKTYSAHGITDFVLCLGYKGYLIKEYFSNYFLHMSDVTFDMGKNKMEVHSNHAEPWKVTLVDTGLETMTGGRLKRIGKFLDNEDFCMTYGDGVADINVTELIQFHKKSGKLATVTATRPAGRFGAIRLEGDEVQSFEEKPLGDGGYINGGYFVLSPKTLEYVENDKTIWEQDPMRNLARDRQLNAYRHDGFWQPMDTIREKILLENLWSKNNAPWKVWK